MRDNFAGTWHPNVDVDLHHAMLGNGLGGGIAYLGVLCNENFGFGLTASMSGNFQSMDATVMWDMKAFMHEVSFTEHMIFVVCSLCR
jgi:hypothetical protein